MPDLVHFVEAGFRKWKDCAGASVFRKDYGDGQTIYRLFDEDGRSLGYYAHRPSSFGRNHGRLVGPPTYYDPATGETWAGVTDWLEDWRHRRGRAEPDVLELAEDAWSSYLAMRMRHALPYGTSLEAAAAADEIIDELVAIRARPVERWDPEPLVAP